MNIEEVRLKLVQQIIDRGCQEPNTIRKLIEPIARYVVTGEFPGKQESDIEIIQMLRGRAKFCRGKGEVKTPQLLEQAANLLEQKTTPPKKP